LIVTSAEGGDRRSDAARESRSVFYRPLHPAKVRKVLLWVCISLFALVDFFGSRVEKPWTSKPLFKGVGIAVVFLLLWVVTVRLRDVAVRRRQAKSERSPDSSPPINPA
jgi:hypothetical protein